MSFATKDEMSPECTLFVGGGSVAQWEMAVVVRTIKKLEQIQM